jgi:hypothetical protein
VWITLLASMAEEGFVDIASPRNLALVANVSLEATIQALEVLTGPDPESSDPANEGRRLQKVDGGYVVLNAAKYRELSRREDQKVANRTRVANFRERQRESRNAPVMRSNTSEADAEAPTTEKQTKTESPQQELIPAERPARRKAKPLKQATSARGTRLPNPYPLTAEMAQVAVAEGVNAHREHQRFCNYWWAAPGQKGVKLDWLATWRNWCMKAADGGHSAAPVLERDHAAAAEAAGVDLNELDDERAARLAREPAEPATELYQHLLKPGAPRPEHRPDPGAVALASMRSDQGAPQLRPGVQGFVRRGG